MKLLDNYSVKGFSCVELLIALLISGAVMAMTYPAVKAQLTFNARTHINQQIDAKAAFILESIKAEISTAILLSGLETAIFHPEGKLKFPNQSISSALLTTLSKLKIQEQSNAISFFAFNKRIVLEMQNCSNSAQQLCSNVKPGSKELDIISDTTHWLAIGIDGVSLLNGDLTRKTLPCALGVGYRSTLVKFSTQLSTDTLPFLCQSQLLFPLTDSFTVYLDTTSTLRRISHLSSEHQPIARDVKQFQLQTSEADGYTHAKLSLTLIDPNTNFERTTDTHLFATTAYPTNNLDWID